MTRTRWATVLACFLGPALTAWVVLDLALRYQGWVPALTPWGAGLALLVSAAVLAAGLSVRRLRAHERTWVTPLGAAVTAVAAQASSRVAALVGGVYAAGLVVSLAASPTTAMTTLRWTSGACLAACALWCAVGLLVESWCAIDDAGDDDEAGHEPSHPSGAAPA